MPLGALSHDQPNGPYLLLADISDSCDDACPMPESTAECRIIRLTVRRIPHRLSAPQGLASPRPASPPSPYP